MDTSFIIPFVGGAFATAIAVGMYAKFYGLNLLAIGKIISSSNAYAGLEAELKKHMGNISLKEAGEIFAEAKRLSVGGYSEEEKEQLFKKIIEAAASK